MLKVIAAGEKMYGDGAGKSTAYLNWSLYLTVRAYTL